MRDYELAFIIRPTVNDEGVAHVVDLVSQNVQAINGEVTSVDVWGRRVLAYPINKHREGIYVLFQAKLPPVSLVELERNLNLSEEIIRYLLVKVDK
jgi:small subunit ribosomal protein S6